MNKKFIIIILCLAVVLASMFTFSYFNGYSSDIECINSTGGLVSDVDTVLFKYESGNRELLLYSDEEGEFYSYTLKVHKIGSKRIYKYAGFNNLHPDVYSKKWTTLNRNVKYVYTKYERGINDIDCEGIEPISTSFEYNIKNGEKESCCIHIIDKSK